MQPQVPSLTHIPGQQPQPPQQGLVAAAMPAAAGDPQLRRHARTAAEEVIGAHASTGKTATASRQHATGAGWSDCEVCLKAEQRRCLAPIKKHKGATWWIRHNQLCVRGTKDKQAPAPITPTKAFACFSCAPALGPHFLHQHTSTGAQSPSGQLVTVHVQQQATLQTQTSNRFTASDSC